MKKYRIYIDETGNSDLKFSDNPNHRFLSLTGIIIQLDYIKSILHNELENLKAKFFNSHPDEPIILHRKELVNKRYPFNSLNNPKTEKKFNQYLINKLKEWEFTVITVLIDKKEHTELYKTWKYDPYHYCLAILMERYLFFLEEKESIGDVMIESRGGNEDKRLKKSFNKLFNEGTDFVKKESFAKYFTSCQLKVKAKANNISGLQLADILAHPSRNHILKENGLFTSKRETFGDEIINVLKQKYHKSKEGKIVGFGIKKLP